MDHAHRPGPWVSAAAWAVAIYLLVPITIVIPVSLTDQRFLSLPQEALSLRHYATVLGSPEWLNSIWQSFLIAVASTAIAVVAGTLCAIGCWRLSRKSTELIRALMLLPIIIPSIVYAIGLYRYFANLDLLDRFLGASLSQTLRWVILPRIAPGIVSGAIFAFIHSWDELVIVLFIASRDVFTLPRRIWDGINENLDPAMAAVAVLLVVFTLLLLLLDLALRKRRDA
jgi:putative spermidine/putrescine transport system permease protein